MALLLYKSFGQAKRSWIEFFLGFSYATALVCGALFTASAAYFWLRTRGPAAAARPAALDAWTRRPLPAARASNGGAWRGRAGGGLS